MEKTFELSSKKYKNGRRKFSAVLYKLQPPECVVDGKGTEYNKNGITFLEKYAEKELDSIEDMSVTVEFLDDKRTEICAHGLTSGGSTTELPRFDDATVVGHFTKGYITDVEVNNEKIRAVCGDGYLDEMRYADFVAELESDLANGYSVDGSIEIFRDENHDTIIYENDYTGTGRIPKNYIHSGWSFVLNPSDTASQLLELNNQIEKEDNKMDESMLKSFVEDIKATIIETNSKNEDLDKKVCGLNAMIEEKDNTIAELNANSQQIQSALDSAKKELDDSYKKINELYEEIKRLQKMLGEAQARERISEMNSAISNFSEEERGYAKDEIAAFEANPIEVEINSIVDKIYAEIGKKAKETEKIISEQNAAKVKEAIDIFSDVTEVNPIELNDNSIF